MFYLWVLTVFSWYKIISCGKTFSFLVTDVDSFDSDSFSWIIFITNEPLKWISVMSILFWRLEELLGKEFCVWLMFDLTAVVITSLYSLSHFSSIIKANKWLTASTEVILFFTDAHPPRLSVVPVPLSRYANVVVVSCGSLLAERS